MVHDTGVNKGARRARRAAAFCGLEDCARLAVLALSAPLAMSNDLRDKGIEIANEAVQADNAGQYESAIQKYCKAASTC